MVSIQVAKAYVWPIRLVFIALAFVVHSPRRQAVTLRATKHILSLSLRKTVCQELYPYSLLSGSALYPKYASYQTSTEYSFCWFKLHSNY